MKKYIIPIFIPHLGCPNDCIFCNQRYITKKENPSNLENLDSIIEEYLEYFPVKKNIEIAFYGGSFTGIGEDLIKKYLSYVNKYIQAGVVDGIRVSTRADYINQDILNFLEDGGVTTIELGVQSMVDRVLKSNNRGCNVEDVEKATNLIRKNDFELGLQMMTGLYDSTEEDDVYTAIKISDLQPDFVRIYPTMILENTRLMHLYKTNKYYPKTLEETIEILKNIVPIFEAKDINIIRIGLHNSGDREDKMIGPKHDAIKQLTYSDFYKEMLDKYFQNKSNKEFTLKCSNKYLDYVCGYKSRNKKYLNEKYHIKLNFEDTNIDSKDIIILENQEVLSFTSFIKGKADEIRKIRNTRV